MLYYKYSLKPGESCGLKGTWRSLGACSMHPFKWVVIFDIGKCDVSLFHTVIVVYF